MTLFLVSGSIWYVTADRNDGTRGIDKYVEAPDPIEAKASVFNWLTSFYNPHWHEAGWLEEPIVRVELPPDDQLSLF